MHSGIYIVENTKTRQNYIGRSVRPRARLKAHFWNLRAGCHNNPHLQASFDKYGEAAFRGRVLLVCAKEHLPMYEQRAIVAYRSAEREFGFNQMGVLDEHYVHGEEARQATADRNRRNWKEPEYRERRIETQHGIIARQWQDPAFRELRSRSASEQWDVPGARETFRRKRSVTARVAWMDPEYQEQQRLARLAAWENNTARREATAATLKALWQDPVYVAKQKASRAKRKRDAAGRYLPVAPEKGD